MPRKTAAIAAATPASPAGFNEAAARCRGKPDATRVGIAARTPLQ